MIICSVSIAVIFLIVFIISAKNGQFDDDESPAVRILLEDKKQETAEKRTKTEDASLRKFQDDEDPEMSKSYKHSLLFFKKKN